MNQDWEKWRAHLLDQQKYIMDRQMEMLSVLTGIHVEIAQLKLKASLWGALAGCIPVVVMLTMKLAFKGG